MLHVMNTHEVQRAERTMRLGLRLMAGGAIAFLVGIALLVVVGAVVALA